jgi:hypothetical protein
MLGLACPALALAPPAGPRKPAPAQPDKRLEEARAIADRAFALFKAGDYAEAILLFQQAEAISHSPIILSFIARAHESLGQLVEAQQQYLRILSEPPAEGSDPDFVGAYELARSKAPVLERRIPRVKLRLSGVALDRVEVDLDGYIVPRDKLGTPIQVNPGPRKVVVRAPGRAPVTRTFAAEERQVAEVEVVFEATTPAAPPPPPGMGAGTVGALVAFAVALGGLSVGVVDTALYFARAGSLEDQCPDGRCPPALEHERDTLRALGTAAIVGYAVGGAGLAAGVLVVVLAPGDAPEGPATTGAATRLELGPRGLVVRGRF